MSSLTKRNDLPNESMFMDTNEAGMLFNNLRDLVSTPESIGVTRGSYSEEETKSLQLLSDYAEQEGLAVVKDAAQNWYFSLPEDKDAQSFILIGSHIDSVPQGGNYDGAAGIVAGIICLVQARRNGICFAKPVKVVAIRGEESAWFGHCYMGSKAMLGLLPPETLQATHRETGNSLANHMEQVGVDVAAIKKGQAFIDPSKVAAYLELHIEQGPVLVETNRPLAIVSGIRGNIRHGAIHCVGEAGHSGAVPREFRHDSVFAVASLLMRLDDHWKTLLAHGADLVVTSGIMCTNQDEHAISRIPGDVSFSFEVRSEHTDVLNTVESLLESESKIVSRDRNVTFNFDKPISSSPALLSSDIVEQIKKSAASMGVEPFVMASGAGHDAAVFAGQGIPTGMIFVRNQHGSHNPDEAMELDDFMLATQVLYNYLETTTP